MKKRLYYSNDFKRLALIEVIKGNKFENILISNGYDISALVKKDKKYCSKLFHKWCTEFRKDNERIYFLNTSVCDNIIKEEIKNLNFNYQNDVIMISIKKKINNCTERYKNLKFRITSTYARKV